MFDDSLSRESPIIAFLFSKNVTEGQKKNNRSNLMTMILQDHTIESVCKFHMISVFTDTIKSIVPIQNLKLPNP